jgi:beta/gamma crystallin
MKTIQAILAIFAAAATAAAAEVVVYKQPNFKGDALTLRGDTTNLGDRGFLDQVSSLVVKSGQWQFCTQPDFKGDCVVLERGEYPALEQSLNHRIESAREVTRYADRSRDQGNRYGFQGRAPRQAAVEVFTAPEFRGQAARIDRDMDSLYERLDQGAASIVIREGNWELCSRPGYEGVCRVFEPGEYADLGRLYRRVASLRRVG